MVYLVSKRLRPSTGGATSSTYRTGPKCLGDDAGRVCAAIAVVVVGRDLGLGLLGRDGGSDGEESVH